MPPSTSSSKGDKKSNGMKPITLPSVAKYLLNVGKSVSNVAVDYFGEISPTTQEFLETNEDLFKEVVSSVVDYKQTLKKATATLKKSKVWEAYTEGKKALFEDLRTGNFYNKQREDSLNAKAIGMDLDFGDDDMEFDDSMFSFDDDDSSDTAKQTRVLDMSIEAAAKANASITAQSGALVAETVKDSTQIMFVQNREMMNKVQAGMTGMANILTDMNKFMNGPLVTGLQNAKTYQEKSLQHLGNLEGMMNELLTMQRNLYAAKQDEYKEEGYNSIFDSDGIPDLKEYGNQIKKNIKSFIGPEFDMLFGNAFGKDSNGLLMMVASPLKFIPELFVKKIIPETVKKSIEVFDQSLSGLFSSLISRIANMGEGEGALDPRSILARILGVDIKIKNSVDTTKFKKGPVPFDGETRQTILKVIPGYLARIESALTGGLERIYDMGTGKWTSIGKVAEDYKKRKENSYKDSWGEAAEPVKEYIRSLKNAKNKDGSDNTKSTERAKELEEAFDKILAKVYNEDKGDFLGYRQKRDNDGDYVNAYEYYDVSEDLYKIIMDILSKPKNRKNMTHIARNVMSERDSWNSYLKMAEEKNSALMNLFDKSYAINADDLTLKNGTGVGYKGGPQNFLAQAVDEHGNNVFFYLREMLGNLMNIADGSGGGKGRRKRGTSRSASRRVEELIKARSEAQAKKDNKQGKGQDIEAEERTLDEINEEIEKARIEAEKELDENGVPMKDRDLDDTEKAFIGKLKDATTFGEKFQAVQNAIDKAMKKPAMILTSMLDTADRKLYELLFGKEELMNLDRDEKHRGPQGVIDMILIKMEESFDNFNDWLKETIMDPVKKWMDEIGLTRMLNKVKDKAKDAWDWTKDKLHLGAITDKLKDKFKWGKDQVTDAFDATALDLAGATGNDIFKRISPSYNRLQSMLDTPDRKLKNVSLALSRRELTQKQYDDAVAAGMSPREALSMQRDQIKKVLENFNKYKKNNAKARAKEELRERAAELGGNQGIKNQIAYHRQELGSQFKGRKVEKRLLNFDSKPYYDFIGSPRMRGKLNRDQIKEGLAIYKQAVIYKNLTHTKAKEEIINHFGITFDNKPGDKPPEATLDAAGRFVTQRGLAVVSPGETILPATYDKAKQKTQLAHEKAYARRFGIKGASYYAEGKEGEDSDTGVAQTVNPEKDQKAVWDTIKTVGKEMNGADSVVDTVADMLIGGGVSLITGMIGGPLLGAAVGAGVSLTKNSATFREMLFGKDLEDGSHEGGVIPKSWQDFASKYLPDVKKYGIVGGVAGLLTPFGLVGGIAAGSAIAMAKNNEDVQEFLFGKMQEDGEGNKFRDGGLISKAFRDQVKKAVPNMLVGAAGMAIAGPFGIFPNAVMGSALGLLTSTDKFKDALLGTKDENGKRRGGVLGALKTGFVNPLLEWGKNLMEETKKWLKETVWDNTKRFLKPFTKMLGNAVGSIVGVIGNFFNEKITMPIYDVVLHKFLEPAGKVAGKLIKAPIALAKTIFGAPFKMLGAVGDNIRATQIGKGTADDMTAAERVDFRKKHEGRHIFNAIAGRDKFGRMDRMLASESFNGKEGVKKMEKMREDIDILFNTKKKLNDKFVELCNKCIQTISDILNSDVVTMPNGSVVSCFTAIKYSNVKRLKDLISKGQIEEAIKEIRSGRWDILATTDVLDKIQSTLEEFAEPIQQAFIQKHDAKNVAKTKMKEIAKQTGLTKMKDLQRLSKNLDTEIKARSKDVKEEEEKSEEQKMREELQEKQWTIERDFLEQKSENFLDVLDDISGYLEDILGYAKKEDEERNPPEEEEEVEGQQSLFGDNEQAEKSQEEIDAENLKAKRTELAKVLAGTMKQLGTNMDRDNFLNTFSGGDIFKDKEILEKVKNTSPQDLFKEIMVSPEFNMELKDLFEDMSTGERKKLRRKMGNFVNTYADDIHKYFEDINPSLEDMREDEEVAHEEVIPETEFDEYGPADGYRGWRKLGAKLKDKFRIKTPDEKLQNELGINHPDNLQKDVNARLNPFGWIGKGTRAIGRGKRSLFHQIGDIGRGIKEGVIEGFQDGNTDGETFASVNSKYSNMRREATANFLDSVDEKKQSIFDKVKSIGGMLVGKKQDVQEVMNSAYNVQNDADGNRAAIGPDGEPLDTATSDEFEESREEEKEIARANSTALGDMAKGVTGMASGLLGKVWNTGKNIVGGVIGKIGDFIDNFGGPVFKVIKLIFGGVTLAAVTGHLADFWTNTLGPVIKPFFKNIGDTVLEIGGDLLSGFRGFIEETWPGLGQTIDKVTATIKSFIDNPIDFIKNFYVEGLQKFGDYIIEPLGQMIWNVLHSGSLEELTAKNRELVTNKYQKTDSSGNKVYVDAEGKETTEEFDANGNRNTEVELSTTATHYEHNQNLGNRIMSGGLFSGKMITDTYTDNHNGHKYVLDRYNNGLIVIKNKNTGSYVKFTLGGDKLEMGWKVDKNGKCKDPGLETVALDCGIGAVVGGVAGLAAGAGVTMAAGASMFGSTTANAILGSAAAGSVVPGVGTVIGVAAGVIGGIGIYIWQKNSGSVAEIKLDLNKSDEELSASMLLLSFGWVGGIGEFRQWPQWQVEYDEAAKGSTTADDDDRFDSTLTYNENKAGNKANTILKANSNVIQKMYTDQVNAVKSGTIDAEVMAAYANNDPSGLSGEQLEQYNSLVTSSASSRKKKSGKGHIYQNGLDMANEKLGNSTIGDSGCGPVAVTNLINRMGGNMDVDTAARVAEAGGYIDSTGGTTTNYISDMLNRAGMSARETFDKTSIFESLRQGNPAVLLGNSGAERGTPFGANDHYINAMGMDNAGNIYAEDPDLPQSMVKYKASDVMRDMDVGIMTGTGRSPTESTRRNRPRGAIYGRSLQSSIRRQGFRSSGHRRRSGKSAEAAPLDSGGGSINGVNNTVWIPAWVIKAHGIIIGNEGGYESIAYNDNGSGMSVGKCQWNKGRAQDILRKILTSLMQSNTMTEADIKAKIGESLYNDIMVNEWNKRECKSSEGPGLKEILGTDISKNVQDAQAFKDIQGYYDDVFSRFFDVKKQENVVIYCCDFYHQYGSYKKLVEAAKSAAGGSYEDITLEIIHETCLKTYSKYHDRRNKVYTTLLGSDLAGDSLVDIKAPYLEDYIYNAAMDANYSYEAAGGEVTKNGIAAQLNEVLTGVFKGVLKTAGLDPELFDTLFGDRVGNSMSVRGGDYSYTNMNYMGRSKVNSAQLALPAWLAAKEGQIKYTQEVSDPENNKASCAATTYYAYRKALAPFDDKGINHNSSFTWEKKDDRFLPVFTSPRYNNPNAQGGFTGDLDTLQPGDVLFYSKPSATAAGNTHHIYHTAMYAGEQDGEGMIWNHGGNPEYGPVLKKLTSNKDLSIVKRYKPFLDGEQVPFWNPDGTRGVYTSDEAMDKIYESEDRFNAISMDGAITPAWKGKVDKFEQANQNSIMYKQPDPLDPMGLYSSTNKNAFTLSNTLTTPSITLPTTTTNKSTGAMTGSELRDAGLITGTPTDINVNPYTSKITDSSDEQLYRLVDGSIVGMSDIDAGKVTMSQMMGAKPIGDFGNEGAPMYEDDLKWLFPNESGSRRKSGKGRKSINLMGARNRFMTGMSRFRKKASMSKAIKSKKEDEDYFIGQNDDGSVPSADYIKRQYSGGARSATSATSITQDQFLQTIIALLRIIAKNSEKTDRIVELLGSIDIHVTKSDVAKIDTSANARSNIDKAIKAAKVRRSGRGGNPNRSNGTKPGDFGGAQNRDKNDIDYVIQTLQEFARA